MFDLPSLRGFKPRRYVQASWSPHVPFAYDLIAALRPKLLVELGTHTGVSYFTFCQSAQENGTGTVCYAVDTWKGDPQAGFYGEEIFGQVDRYNRENYAGFSYLLRMPFDEALVQFVDGSIDLLHIDGLHTYEAVRHDYETWLPKVREGGLVLLHDIAVRRPTYGVWKLWEEIAAPGRSFSFHHGWGLGLVKKSPDRPLESDFLNRLFAAPDDSRESIRRYYVRLWEALETAHTHGDPRRESAAEIANLRREIATLKQEVGRLSSELQSQRESFTWKIAKPLRKLKSALWNRAREKDA